MIIYLTIFTGIALFILLRGLIHLLIQLTIPPVYRVRSVETAGFFSESFVKTKRLVWLNGIETPVKIDPYCHPHEGDECLSKEYWVGSKLVFAKILCLASKDTGELSYL